MPSDSRLTGQELAELEALIDRRGIEDVLIAVSEICDAKADLVNSQDATLALRWATLCGAVGCIVPKATGL